MPNTLEERGWRAKKLQIVVARGLLLANIRAPFPDSGFGAQKTARLVGSLAENELDRCRLRRFFASSEEVEVVINHGGTEGAEKKN